MQHFCPLMDDSMSCTHLIHGIIPTLPSVLSSLGASASSSLPSAGPARRGTDTPSGPSDVRQQLAPSTEVPRPWDFEGLKVEVKAALRKGAGAAAAACNKPLLAASEESSFHRQANTGVRSSWSMQPLGSTPPTREVRAVPFLLACDGNSKQYQNLFAQSARWLPRRTPRPATSRTHGTATSAPTRCVLRILHTSRHGLSLRVRGALVFWEKAGVTPNGLPPL